MGKKIEKEGLEINPLVANKITMILSGYTLFHSIENLKYTTDYRKNVKTKCNEMLTCITREFKEDFGKLWKNDDRLSYELSSSLEEIGKAIANSKNPKVLLMIKALLKEDLDFDKVKIVELKHPVKYKEGETIKIPIK